MGFWQSKPQRAFLIANTVDDIKKAVLNGALPLLLQLAVYISSGLYVITVVKDREDNLRRLLHLSGMRPLAYYLGLFLGDLILINIPATLAIVIAAILQVQTFIDHFAAFIGSLFLFSLSFLPFNYSQWWTKMRKVQSRSHGRYQQKLASFRIPPFLNLTQPATARTGLSPDVKGSQNHQF